MSSAASSGSLSGAASAPIDPASPVDPATTSPSLPPPFGSLNQDSFKATLMSIYGTTDPTPTAGAGASSNFGMPAASSITGGAGPGGFNSPSSGSLNGLGLNLNSLGGLSPQGTGTSGAAGLTNTVINAAAAQAQAAAALGAGGGATPTTVTTPVGTDSSAAETTGSSSLDSSSNSDSDSNSNNMTTPGAEEAQRQAEELARQEGKPNANAPEKQDEAGPSSKSETAAGFFKVVPDSPARIALVEIRQGNYDSALVHLNQLWRLNPQAIELQYLMGVACVMSRRPREAEEHYRNVLQSPSAPPELKQLALKGLSRLRPQ